MIFQFTPISLQKLCQRFETPLVKQIAQLHVVASVQIDAVSLLNSPHKSVSSDRTKHSSPDHFLIRIEQLSVMLANVPELSNRNDRKSLTGGPASS